MKGIKFMETIRRNLTLTNAEKTLQIILLIIFAGVVFHAPISVALGSVWPNFDLIFKSWKEILLVAGLILAGFIYYKKRPKLAYRNLYLLIAGYCALAFVSGLVLFQGFLPFTAGLMIDLRYLVYFGLVLFVTSMHPDFTGRFLRWGFVAALVSMTFVILQMTVLPIDSLKYIGYGPDTIQPYLTIDKNYDFVRMNGTLRGPNPLGAYSLIILTLEGLWVYKNYKNLTKKQSILLSILIVGSMMAMWVSYSRSALIGLGLSLLTILFIKYKSKLNRKTLIIGLGCLVVFGALLFAAKDSYFVSNVLLHENPTEGNAINSNEDHVSSLQLGIDRMLAQPFGAGVGSTGSASLYGESPLIIENQYLFIAHELGWLGFVLFILIYLIILKKLYDNKKSWLALGVLASGVGLAVVGLVLPVWADDTVSLVWWGLAAVALVKVKKNDK